MPRYPIPDFAPVRTDPPPWRGLGAETREAGRQFGRALLVGTQFFGVLWILLMLQTHVFWPGTKLFDGMLMASLARVMD